MPKRIFFILFLVMIGTVGTAYGFWGDGWQNVFCKIALFGSSDIINCENMKDTLTFKEGSGIGITLDNNTKTVTISLGGSREALVDKNDNEVTPPIGTNYQDAYSTANAVGHATLIDTIGMETVRFIILWQYQLDDTGSQTCRIVDFLNLNNILIESGELNTGLNDFNQTIPVGLENTVKNYKLQCKSTETTDTPLLFGYRVYLSP